MGMFLILVLLLVGFLTARNVSPGPTTDREQLSACTTRTQHEEDE